MNKIQQKTNDQLRTQGLGTDEQTDGRTDKGIPVYLPLCEWGYNNKIQQKTNDQLRTQGLGTDGRTEDKGIPVYPPLCEWGYNYNITTLCIPNIENKSWVTEEIGD